MKRWWVSNHHRLYSEPSLVSGDMGREQDSGLSAGTSGEPLLREPEGNQAAGENLNVTGTEDMGRYLARGREREVYRGSPGLSGGLDMREETLHQGWEILRGHYDGIRETFAERIRAIAEGFQQAGRRFKEFLHAASEFFRRTEYPLTAASSNLDQACERTEQELRSGDGYFRERIRSLSAQKREEIRLFEKSINLSQYVASQGYIISWKESHLNSAVMVHDEKKEKLIITRLEGHQWHYFNVDKRYDKGTIIDFVQRQKRLPLERVREMLRPCLESSGVRVSSWSYADRIANLSTSRQNVLESFYRGSYLQDSSLLEKTGLTPSTIDCERFKGMIWEDRKGNVLFPHYDRQGLLGYEILGQVFRGFSEEGGKALWESQKKDTDQRLVIVDSALDALSYHQLHDGDGKTRYVATGGDLSASQHVLIEHAIEKMPDGSKVILAFEKNGQGDTFAKEVSTLSTSAAVTFERQAPQTGKDWNEELHKIQKERELRREQELKLERQRMITRSYELEM